MSKNVENTVIEKEDIIKEDAVAEEAVADETNLEIDGEDVLAGEDIETEETIGVAEDAPIAEDFKFNPGAFVENLKYMGLGMLGIFAVIGIIIIVTSLLSKIKTKDAE